MKLEEQNIELVWMDPKEIEPNPLNWRVHPKNQVEITESMIFGEDGIGWAGVALYNKKTNRLIDGHCRRELAIKHKAKIPVIVGEWDERQEKLILSTLDPIAGLAMTDAEMLEKVMQGTNSTDKKVNEFLSDFAEKEKIIFGDNGSTGEDSPKELLDKADELKEKWQTKDGDVWQLGKHQLICCDSNDVFDFKCDGICTDPPYDLTGQNVIKLIENFSDIAVVLCSDSLAFDLTKFWDFKLNLIWKKKKSRKFPGNNLPILFHSLILVITKSKNMKRQWKRPTNNFPSIVECNHEYDNGEFGHGKSVKVFELMMAGFDWKKVADPFCGTGATIIACENTKRQCIAVEKDPKIAAVALERWVNNFPEQQPVLLD